MTDIPDMRGVQGVSPDVRNHPHLTVSAASTLPVQPMAKSDTEIFVIESGTTLAPDHVDCCAAPPMVGSSANRKAQPFGTPSFPERVESIVEADERHGFVGRKDQPCWEATVIDPLRAFFNAHAKEGIMLAQTASVVPRAWTVKLTKCLAHCLGKERSAGPSGGLLEGECPEMVP